jgi:hypothetical protein
MLRDSMDELLAPGAGSSRSVLARLATAWAELLGAECCAVGLFDADAPSDLRWVAGGPQAGACPAPDLTARRALDGGVPVVYVRHEGSMGGQAADPPSAASPIRQAIAAFPLEAVSGILWFQDVRLPVYETDERLQALRRAARRLGRVLGLWVRLHVLERERALSARAADLALAAAGAAKPDDVMAKLQAAIAAEFSPEAIVLHFGSESEPELATPVSEGVAIPPAIPAAEASELLALADRLGDETRGSASAVCRTQRWQGREIQALAAAIREPGGPVRGTLVLYRGLVPHAPAAPWDRRDAEALERLLRHVEVALAQVPRRPSTPGAGTTTLLDRNGLESVLATEVKRADRYGAPLLLTVLDVEAPAASGGLRPEHLHAFMRTLRARLRDLDYLAELGPGRIAVLSPHTDRQGGRVVIRARGVLSDLAAEFPAMSTLGLRGNQVQYPGDAASLAELLTRLG